MKHVNVPKKSATTGHNGREGLGMSVLVRRPANSSKCQLAPWTGLNGNLKVKLRKIVAFSGAKLKKHAKPAFCRSVIALPEPKHETEY